MSKRESRRKEQRRRRTRREPARLPSRVYIPSTCSPKGRWLKGEFNPMRIRSTRTEDRIHGVVLQYRVHWAFTKILLCRGLYCTLKSHLVNCLHEVTKLSRSCHEAGDIWHFLVHRSKIEETYELHARRWHVFVSRIILMPHLILIES